MEYIHYNPVTEGLCASPEEYKYSSTKFYESRMDEFGFLTIGWLEYPVLCFQTDVGDAGLQTY